MRIDFPEMIELPNDRSESYIRAIESKANPQMDLVCCILSNNRKDRYEYDSFFNEKIKRMFSFRCLYQKHYKNKVN
jgi:hypothetical protein